MTLNELVLKVDELCYESETVSELEDAISECARFQRTLAFDSDYLRNSQRIISCIQKLASQLAGFRTWTAKQC